MQTTLPLPVAQVKQAFDSLSEDHKMIFEEALESERAEALGEGAAEIPQWHLDILKEREKLWQAGKTTAQPIDEAFAEIRQRIAERRKERSA